MKKLTPTEVGDRYGVNFTTVLSWIAAGFLPATDCSRPTATRRRWRMDEDDLAEFDRRRGAKKTSATPRQRVSRTEAVEVFV